MNMLKLFCRWCIREAMENEICLRQLAMKSPTEHSCFFTGFVIFFVGMVSIHVSTSRAIACQIQMKDHCVEINQFYGRKIWTDIQSKSSLIYINTDIVKVGQSHPVWATVWDNVYDSRRAQTKCRLLTGTYTLQSNRTVFEQHAVDPTSKLCCSVVEPRQHFLAERQALTEERSKNHSQVGAVTDRLTGSIFLKTRHFIIQERFNKLIYGINTIIQS